MSTEGTDSSAVDLATELTVAWLSNPNTRVEADQVPAFLARMHQAVRQLSEPPVPEQTPEQQEFTPAVSARKSLASKDFILSMIDGKPYKTLRRHLSGHGLTPEQYRERFGLKSDYPMVSASYSEMRRAMAQKIGLGRKPRKAAEGGNGKSAATAAPAAKPARKRATRKAAVE